VRISNIGSHTTVDEEEDRSTEEEEEARTTIDDEFTTTTTTTTGEAAEEEEVRTTIDDKFALLLRCRAEIWKSLLRLSLSQCHKQPKPKQHSRRISQHHYQQQ